MPKTKFQSVIFTMMMVFCMVYCMTIYTITLKYGTLNFTTFSLGIREMWMEYAVVFCLVFFFVTRTAMKLTRHAIGPVPPRPVLTMLSMQFFTVCMVVPCITLFATFYHHGFTSAWLMQWLGLAAECYPMALALQIILVGPFVRFCFRTIFRRQLAPERS